MKDSSKPKLTLLLGCTAAGKTSASIELAARIGAEIVSVDSMQVYRRMDIGTAKSSIAERCGIPHHLIDIVEPSESFSVARFVEMADAAITDIAARGRTPLVVAGTPLYLMGLMFGLFDGPSANEEFRTSLKERAEAEGVPSLHAVLTKIDPVAANRIHANDYKRIERALEVHHLTGRPLSEQQIQWDGPMRYPARIVGLRRDREDLSMRINARVKTMIDAGLVKEVRDLLCEPQGMSEQARQALGYAQIIKHLAGEMSLPNAIEEIKITTRQFAKHQRTWFRKFPTTQWLDIAPDESTGEICSRLVSLLTDN